MDAWLVAILSVLGVLVGVLVVLPVLVGIISRATSSRCRSKLRMDGKTVIITGASSGIGREAALELAKRGARVVMACRNMEKAKVVAESIIAESGNTNVLVRLLDVSDLHSVRMFAAAVIKEEPTVHVLINNAGVLMDTDAVSKQGFQLVMATNHYGHFLLTNLLMNKLKESAPARVVTVASLGYLLNELDISDLNYRRRKFRRTGTYCQSKLCNVLFTKELAKRIEGTGVTSNCLHPGFVASDIFDREKTVMGRLNEFSARVSGLTIKQGAQTTVYLAVDPDISACSGGYYENCKKSRTYRKANDAALAWELWEVTAADVGLASHEELI